MLLRIILLSEFCPLISKSAVHCGDMSADAGTYLQNLVLREQLTVGLYSQWIRQHLHASPSLDSIVALRSAILPIGPLIVQATLREWPLWRQRLT